MADFFKTPSEWHLLPCFKSSITFKYPSSIPAHVQENRSDGNELKADWKKVLISYNWILLIIIPMMITGYVRLQPMDLVPLEQSAESNVLSYYRAQAKAEIIKLYPNLPDSQRDSLADQRLNEILASDQGKVIQDQIKQASDSFKSRLQYESGSSKYAYLGDIDSYYWLRMSRNIIEKGTQCDMIQDGKCYDTYTIAPIPLHKGIEYYPFAILAVFKFLKPFMPDLTLMQASFLTPLAFALLLTIPLFLLLRRLAGNVAGVVGTIMVNVNPFVLTRSLVSDNDIVYVFFQALFLGLL